MGQRIDNCTFDVEEHQRRLRNEKQAFDRLRETMQNDDDVPTKIGVEVEFFLVDNEAKPKQCNISFVNAVEGNFVCEISQSSAEFNSNVVIQSTDMFDSLYQDVSQAWQRANQVAHKQNCHLSLIGTVPTAVMDDYGPAMLTPEKRYQDMSQLLSDAWNNKASYFVISNKKIPIPKNFLPMMGSICSTHIHFRVPSRLNPAVFRAAQINDSPDDSHSG